MSGKSKRQEDAESIIGKHADELEVEDQKLVGRTANDIDPLAVVERKHKSGGGEYVVDDAVDEDEEEEKKRKALKKRADHAKNTHEDEEDEEEEDGEGRKKRKKKKGPPFGGAKSLADAEIFMVDRAGDDPILLDSLNVLAGVLTNIAGAKHGEAIATELADYQTRLDARVLRTLTSVEQSLTNGTEVTMPEVTEVLDPQAEVTEAEAAPNAAEVEAQPEADANKSGEHVLEPVFASLRAAYDEARETPADQAVRLKMIQEPLNNFAAALKANIGGTDAPAAEAVGGGGVTLEQIQQAVALGVAPIAAELEALKSASAASAPVAPVAPTLPVRRALQTAALDQQITGPPAALAIPEAEWKNAKSEHNVTPGIRGLVRRTVGLG